MFLGFAALLLIGCASCSFVSYEASEFEEYATVVVPQLKSGKPVVAVISITTRDELRDTESIAKSTLEFFVKPGIYSLQVSVCAHEPYPTSDGDRAGWVVADGHKSVDFVAEQGQTYAIGCRTLESEYPLFIKNITNH